MKPGSVLFGGSTGSSSLSVVGDTWTWDGTTWTQQHPATSPSAGSTRRWPATAATGAVVLFGGHGRHRFDKGAFTWG